MAAYRIPADDGPLTIEEYARLSPEDGWNSDLVRGRLVREPWSGAAHGGLTLELGATLRDFVRSRQLGRQLGRVLVDCGFILSDDPPTVRAPDFEG